MLNGIRSFGLGLALPLWTVLFCGSVIAQTLTLTGPSTVRPGQTITVNLNLSNPPASLAALARSDLNGDGKTDVLDLQLMIQEILIGTIANDQNGDGIANVRDAQIVARAATGN